MDSLPPEILSIILVGALPPFLSDLPYETDSGFAHARICSVCKKWNNVALSTPRFWSQIMISAGVSYHKVMKRRLTLSQQSKLRVHMELILLMFEDCPSESFREVHSLLLEAIGRWRIFSIRGYAIEPQELATWIPSVIPCVEDISFDVCQWDQAAAGIISAPKLSHCVCNIEKNLIFRECNMMSEYSTAGFRFGRSRFLPWGQLISDLHRNCSALKVLEIGGNKVSSAEPPFTWPPLLQLQILRFTKVTHKTVNTILIRLDAPNLQVVELVGTSSHHDSRDQTAAVADIELPTIELPPGVSWRLRFKESTPAYIRDASEHIEIQPPPLVEVDLMGLIPRWTLTAQFGSVQAGANSLFTSESLRECLETGWAWILDHLPSVIWVIERGQGDWVPVNPGQPLSIDEGVDYILGATTGRIEYKRFCSNPWPGDESS